MRFYDRLKQENGEEAAREYMRQLRASDKPAGGMSYVDPERRKAIMEKVRSHRKTNENHQTADGQDAAKS